MSCSEAIYISKFVLLCLWWCWYLCCFQLVWYV